MSETTEVVAQALTEYGEAIRGDWGSIDGRGVRTELHELAALLRLDPTPAPDISELRRKFSLCPGGGGHWTEHCWDDDPESGCARG